MATKQQLKARKDRAARVKKFRKKNPVTVAKPKPKGGVSKSKKSSSRTPSNTNIQAIQARLDKDEAAKQPQSNLPFTPARDQSLTPDAQKKISGRLDPISPEQQARITQNQFTSGVRDVFSSFAKGATGQQPDGSLQSLSAPEILGYLGGFYSSVIGVEHVFSKIAKGVQSINVIGAPAIKKTATQVAVNTKTLKNVENILSFKFSRKALNIAGAWAGSVAIGKWAQKEAPEPISYLLPDLRAQAQQTGDWSLVHEAEAVRDEVLDRTIWEDIASWSPLSPFTEITKAIDAGVAAAKISDKYTADLEHQQVNGESDDERWGRVRAEQAAQDKAAVDYYNTERIKLLQWEQEAKIAQRNDDAAFWRKERARQRELEAADRKAIADFWIAYRKQAQKEADNNRPSKLNFGFL